jgi:glycosyltransferase involved in cell wall biosynthesis
MNILFTISYYTPYISGLTLHAKNLAEILANKGYAISVITTQYKPDLFQEQIQNKVRIIRVPSFFKFHKGFIMPSYPWYIWSNMRKADIAVSHLPQAESFLTACIAKLMGKKFYVIYHCEVVLPSGIANRVLEFFLNIAHLVSLFCAEKIITYTKDYADHSFLLCFFKNKIVTIYPPIPFPVCNNRRRNLIKKYLSKKPRYCIGVAARFAAEKGFEYLISAIPFLEKRIGRSFKIIFAGPEHPVGEEKYWRKMQPLLQRYKDYIVFIGIVPYEAIGNFYNILDVLVLPSINRTEAFGMVQVEAMLCGVPVVASDLPGVREPIRMTGMGEIVRPKDSYDLAEKVSKILHNKINYTKKKAVINELFSLQDTINKYEQVLMNKS